MTSIGTYLNSVHSLHLRDMSTQYMKSFVTTFFFETRICGLLHYQLRWRDAQLTFETTVWNGVHQMKYHLSRLCKWYAMVNFISAMENSKNMLVLNLQQIEHIFLHFVSVPGPMLTRIVLNKCLLKDSRNHVTVVLCFNPLFMARCYEMNFSAPCWQAKKGCIGTMIHQGSIQQLLWATDCDPMQVLFCCSPNAGLTHIHWQTRAQIHA